MFVFLLNVIILCILLISLLLESEVFGLGNGSRRNSLWVSRRIDLLNYVKKPFL